MNIGLTERDLTLITWFGLLVFNALVAIVCLIAGPHHWTRRVCAIAAGCAVIMMLLLTALFIYDLAWIFLTTGWGEESEFAFLPVIFGILPLLGEFLALKAIYRWRLRDQSAR